MIVPALLTDNLERMQIMLDVCAKFTNFAQIDIMDGEFVNSKSITLDQLKTLKSKINTEAHLMVNDPLAWVSAFKKIGSSRILFHYEIKADLEKIIDEIKQQGLQAGLAVNPSTKIEDFKGLVSKLDAVLFMSVIPGFYGAEFIPEVLDKVKEFRKLYPKMVIGIDGGVKPENIKLVKKSGVDYACVGSALMKVSDPAIAYGLMQKAFNE